ncbi:MAG: hypothetical protein RMY16_25430, partial [Nostoc sp. DedQUE12b]|uniref:hypothetical protein n=1 Tax=Nostoc sp. DedQUE12b TaxID=3075398 RepID=UPI002AD51822
TPLALLGETPRPQWLPNARFKFCQPKRDRKEARTIISLWKVMLFIASGVGMISGKINLEPK